MSLGEVIVMPKILIVEDEESIRSFIKVNLKRQEYRVLEADSGEEAIALTDQHDDIAIVLLDVMLPGIDGFEVCRLLRNKYPLVGIIMLTAKGQEADKLEGLSGGADDYMVKPFSPTELMARIEALLRRINLIKQDKTTFSPILISPPFALNMVEKKLFKHEEEISLTPTEFLIIQLFMTHENEALSRDEILDKVWGENYFGDHRVVDVNVRRIRQKIEENGDSPQYIESVWGHGYRFRGHTREIVKDS